MRFWDQGLSSISRGRTQKFSHQVTPLVLSFSVTILKLHHFFKSLGLVRGGFARGLNKHGQGFVARQWLLREK